jgi:hypothetical protein
VIDNQRLDLGLAQRQLQAQGPQASVYRAVVGTVQKLQGFWRQGNALGCGNANQHYTVIFGREGEGDVVVALEGWTEPQK